MLRNFQDLIKEVVKILENFQKSIKEKGLSYGLIKLFSNVFPALQASKQKWWSALTFYYKPTYFWQGLVKENQMTY